MTLMYGLVILWLSSSMYLPGLVSGVSPDPACDTYHQAVLSLTMLVGAQFILHFIFIVLWRCHDFRGRQILIAESIKIWDMWITIFNFCIQYIGYTIWFCMNVMTGLDVNL
jgi:hypothetical protein